MLQASGDQDSLGRCFSSGFGGYKINSGCPEREQQLTL